MPTETELKLWLHPDDIERFRSLPRLRRARAHPQRLRTVYFDTPDFRLAGHGIALRVRRVGRRWVQTLKTEGERSGGLSKRLELETPVSGPAPEFSRLPAETVDKLIRKKWRARLAPVYETRFLRTAWNLRTPDGSRVEVALDVGEIAAGKKSAPLCEVELELKAGSADALHGLAHTLAQQVLLIPFDVSKAERGARLAAGRPCKPATAVIPALEPGMPACVAFVRIARACLAQMQANLPGLLLEEDPEYMHQARVALRRLRSAEGLFRKSCPPSAETMGRMAGLARVLGEARDWDVFVLNGLPGLLPSAADAQNNLLLRRAAAARRKARETALEAVRRPQTGADLLALHRWLSRIETEPGGPKLVRMAEKRLAALHARVLAGAQDFADLSPEQRHALRIRVKRLRYALDYLGGLFAGSRKFAACFAGLQNDLGELNDAATALRFLEKLNHDGRIGALAGRLARELEGRAQSRLVDAVRALESFSRLNPPWGERNRKKERAWS